MSVPLRSTTATLADGAVLVRFPATGVDWATRLPAAPAGTTLTVTVGHVDLLPVPVDDLVAAGYRVVGVASEERPIGPCVDVLVPREVRLGAPVWFAQLLADAERVFDLRHGPVLRVLASELDLHLRATAPAPRAR